MLPDRIEKRIDRTTSTTECWLWTGATNDRGYGMARFGAGAKYIHRIVYEVMVEEIPDGLTLDHICRTPSCCNPEHMEIVTRSENSRRAAGEITHCTHGHEYTAENTGRNSNGTRYCKRCHVIYNVARKKRLRAERGPISPKTHCVNGHAYDEANTHIDKNGHRTCRACKREWMRANYRKVS